jgi:hypothetical protein
VSAPQPPGRSAIAYRAGTHATFKRALLERLAAGRYPALSALTTRDDDDVTIALLDAFAIVADVLTFYQERLSNEAYLRTATELESVAQLGALVGYGLHPGSASETHLAFTATVAGQLGERDAVVLDPGAQVQSLPAPGQLPQTFETAMSLAARPELSALRPLATRPQVPKAGDRTFVVSGITTRLVPGDGLAIVSGETGTYHEVGAVTVDPIHGQTTIGLKSALSAESPAPVTRAVPLEALRAQRQLAETPAFEPLERTLAQVVPDLPEPDGLRIFALRTHARLFGANAPDYKSMPPAIRNAYDPYRGYVQINSATVGRTVDESEPTDWPLSLPFRKDNPPVERPESERETLHRLPLDRQYSVNAGDWVAVLVPSAESPICAQAVEAKDGSCNAFAMSGPTTFLTLKPSADQQVVVSSIGDVRATRVLLQSDELALAAEIPLPAGEVFDASTPIKLDRLVNLEVGRTVAIAADDGSKAHVTTVAQANVGKTAGRAFTEITLGSLSHGQTPPAESYPYAGTTIYGNVVTATHGRSVSEVLGSGDAASAGQAFALRHAPLTYVRSQTDPRGIASTLSIRVGGIAWTEVASLPDAGPRDRVFAASLAAAGVTTVRFGDGVHGARLPSGYENVVASYRYGDGGDDAIAPGAIALLATRPLGVVAATNPVPAGAGRRPDDLESARRNTAAGARALDRIVTLDDYRDFALVYGGFAKARADLLAGLHGPLVGITLAADAAEDTALVKGLAGAVGRAAAPRTPALVGWYRRALFRLAAAIVVAPGYRAQDVVADARSALRAAFSFDRRALAQAVYRSEAVAVLAAVPGVAGVHLTAFARYAPPRPGAAPPAAVAARPVRDALWAARARIDAAGSLTGAELLLLDPTADPEITTA